VLEYIAIKYMDC